MTELEAELCVALIFSGGSTVTIRRILKLMCSFRGAFGGCIWCLEDTGLLFIVRFGWSNGTKYLFPRC